MNIVQHVKWCMKQIKLTSEISFQTDYLQAQLAKHKSDDLEVVSSQFLMKFILFCVTLDLSDNLAEMRQISLSWKTRMSFWTHYPFIQCIWLLTDLRKEHKIHPAHHPAKLRIDPQLTNPEKKKRTNNQTFMIWTDFHMVVQLNLLLNSVYLMGVLVSNVTFFGDDIHVIFVSNIDYC